MAAKPEVWLRSCCTVIPALSRGTSSSKSPSSDCKWNTPSPNKPKAAVVVPTTLVSEARSKIVSAVTAGAPGKKPVVPKNAGPYCTPLYPTSATPAEALRSLINSSTSLNDLKGTKRLSSQPYKYLTNLHIFNVFAGFTSFVAWTGAADFVKKKRVCKTPPDPAHPEHHLQAFASQPLSDKSPKEDMQPPLGTPS